MSLTSSPVNADSSQTLSGKTYDANPTDAPAARFSLDLEYREVRTMTRPPFPPSNCRCCSCWPSCCWRSAAIWWSQGLAHEAQLPCSSSTARSIARASNSITAASSSNSSHTHLAAYQALAARGFVGAEDRLAWIEAAQHANRDAGLYGLDYRLTPRTASPPTLAQGLPLGQTVMTLTLPLLLETDLRAF